MKVNHNYLVNALHVDGITDLSSTQVVASLILDYLYTEAGYRAFLGLVSSLSKVPSYVIPSGSSKSKDPGPDGLEEDFFATLMRRLTDLRDWQIIDLFDLFDRYGDGLIRTRDLFVLIALLVSADARRSTLVFYLHRKELFEILSRRTVPPDLDGDDSDLLDDDGDGEESTEDGMKNLPFGMERRSRRKSTSGSETVSENLVRSTSNTDHSTESLSSSTADDSSTPSSQSGAPMMTFAQFCGVATPVGVPPSRSIAILEKFGVHEGGMFSYQDYLVYGYWVLSHVDAQDDDTAPSGGDEHHHQQQQSQAGGDSQSSRFCVVM